MVEPNKPLGFDDTAPKRPPVVEAGSCLDANRPPDVVDDVSLGFSSPVFCSTEVDDATLPNKPPELAGLVCTVADGLLPNKDWVDTAVPANKFEISKCLYFKMTCFENYLLLRCKREKIRFFYLSCYLACIRNYGIGFTHKEK